MSAGPWHALGFWVFAALAVIPGLFILITRDIVRAAFWLLGALFGFAGLYMVIGADFLAFTQVLVYIGGILVLILFGVMLTHKDPLTVRRTRFTGQIVPGIIVLGLILTGVMYMVSSTVWVGEEAAPEPATAKIGDLLMTKFILPFEVVSVVLLAALVGAVYIARGQEAEATEEAEE